MARKKRSRSRRAFGGFKRSRRRSRSSSSNGGTVSFADMTGAVAYGAVRDDAARLVSPLTSNVPIGTISDEVALGGAAYVALKWLKVKGWFRSFAKATLFNEAGRVGQALRDGSAFRSGNSSQAAASTVPVF